MAKKQTKPKTPQPQKANKTSFKDANKAAEKWTIELATELLERAYDLAAGGAITLTDVLNKLEIWNSSFNYLVEKFPVLLPNKKEILKQIENNTYKGALNGDYVPSVAIFGLKNNHNWKDKTEVEQTVHQTNVISLGDGKNPE